MCLLLLIVDLQINDELSSVVVAQLLFLQSESNKKPIHMYINSPGIVFNLNHVLMVNWNFCICTFKCFFIFQNVLFV